MPNIKFVCLSDMHLGEEDSLLTNLDSKTSKPDYRSPSPVLSQLTECLKELISQNANGSKPTLILNGDIFEIALSYTNEAAMAFERFIELSLPSNPPDQLFGEIIYIPGNHDHHMWELARETQYVNFIQGVSTGSVLNEPWHGTNLFMENSPRPVPSFFLHNLVKRYAHLNNFPIKTVYPNFGLLSPNKDRCAIFHHGHFIESIYFLMTTLKGFIFPDRKKPDNIWDLERENFAWIDFFWSTMGRSGDAGQAVEEIYERLQDEKLVLELFGDLSGSLAKEVDIPVAWEGLEKKIIYWALKKITESVYNKLEKKERKITDKVLSNEAEQDLREYMVNFLKGQILKDPVITGNGSQIPEETTFIFGHTHKPFSRDIKIEEYNGWVNVYNSGGWVMETPEPEEVHGGAVILLDEDLNTASLRMYNESKKEKEIVVREVLVEEAKQANDTLNPFCQYINGLVSATPGPWEKFSELAARSVHVRRENMKTRLYGERKK